MSFFKILYLSTFMLNTLYFSLTFPSIHAVNFVIVNSCPHAVWAAAVPGKSGKLEKGENLTFSLDSVGDGQIWARTNCNFDANGSGTCESGDCDGLLDCKSTPPEGPATLAEYTLDGFNNSDYFFISLVRGFNVAMEFGATSTECTKGIKCAADINIWCPTELRDPGGCNHPCTVFDNEQFCCRTGYKNCSPTVYSDFFKGYCRSAQTYAYDNSITSFSCPSGTDYKVEFCPSSTSVKEATFSITNNCPYTVWAAASPGGGRQLNQGEIWPISVANGATGGRIWARTDCQFDASGRGKCVTGDCNGLLECEGYGAPPNTIAEYALDQYNGMDFIDMSIIDGFNVPMEFGSVSGPCNRVIKCTADIIGQCPNELKVPGGCNGPCPVFKTEEHCCNSGNCSPTSYSRFFKDRCPDVYSYPKDDATSTFTCPTGTNYEVVFCP